MIRVVRRKLLIAALALPLWSRVACAQVRAKLARIGIVEYGTPPQSGFAAAYLAALKRLGYAEPDTLRLERRYAEGDAARFGDLLLDLAASRVDLVFTVGNDIAEAAKRAVPALPVVTAGSEDPVLSGLIREYRRPGGNITGVTYLSPQLAAKRLDLLREAVPGLARVAVLHDPAHFDTYYQDMIPAANAIGLRLQLVEVRVSGELEGAVRAAQNARAQAIFLAPSRMLNFQSRRIAALALGARLPMMAAYSNFTDAGGLMSYGAIAGEMLQRAAAQTAAILAGAKAGDLPFERAATFELVLNMKTAKALGLTIPQSILLRADRMIE